MSKIDLKKELKHLYQPSAREVVQVEVPAFQFLMIDGEGDPNTSPKYAEGPTIQRVHDFIGARCALAGKHHEVYLSDIRRADPTKWRTVIRQPMEMP